MIVGAGCSARQVNTSTSASISAGTTVHATSIGFDGDALPSGRCARARSADRTMAACESAQHRAATQNMMSDRNLGIIRESCGGSR
jgi:hypothetical protein